LTFHANFTGYSDFSKDSGFLELSITVHHAAISSLAEFHRDLFDRILNYLQ